MKAIAAASLLLAACAARPLAAASSPMDPVELPLHVFEFQGHCLEYRLHATFDGHPISTKLDTGAYTTTVPNEGPFRAYTALQAASVRSEMGVDLPSSEIAVKEVRAHGARLDVPRVLRLARDDAGYATLGIDALSKRPFTIDFPRRRLILGAPAPGALAPLTVSDSGKLVLDANVDGETVPAVVDTGTCRSVATASFIRAHPRSFELESKDKVTDATGASSERRFFRLRELRVGPLVVTGVRVLETTEPATLMGGKPVDFALGAEAMEGAEWYFDVPGKKWGIRDSGL